VFPADCVFGAAIALVVGSNFYFGPLIKGERVAMQWGFNDRPTWYAPKWVALWGMVAFMLAFRLFVWLASTYVPQSLHQAELGIAGFSVVVTAAHIFVLKMAEEAAEDCGSLPAPRSDGSPFGS
jgi:hypothetical protein